MPSFILLFLLVLPLAYATTVYEYGNGNGKYATDLQYTQGKIGRMEKFRVVPLKVPVCYQVSYVLVRVENDISIPAIKYQQKTQSVWIAYDQHSDSRSTYTVIVKGQYRCPVWWEPLNQRYGNRETYQTSKPDQNPFIAASRQYDSPIVIRKPLASEAIDSYRPVEELVFRIPESPKVVAVSRNPRSHVDVEDPRYPRNPYGVYGDYGGHAFKKPSYIPLNN